MNDNTGKYEGRADKWLESNNKLFDYLGRIVLCNISPRIFALFHDMGRMLTLPEKSLCESWAGCTINQNQTTDGSSHLDWKDRPFGLNAVVA